MHDDAMQELQELQARMAQVQHEVQLLSVLCDWCWRYA